MLSSAENSAEKTWQSTKQSLTSMHGEVIDVVGRNEELAAVEEFIQNCIESNSGSSLYVAGAPGCGKSAVMHVVVQNYEKGMDENGKQLPKVATLFINCLQLDGVEELRRRVQEKREEVNSRTGEKENQAKKRRGRPARNKTAEACVESTSKWLVVVADELDQLRGISDTQIFNDPHLIFIGVSNRLDLSDKVSATPRRNSMATKRISTASTPGFMIGGTILNFKPYTAEQLMLIMQTRLGKVNGASNLFQPAALMFCAKRVAACSGDARQALDLARRALDLAAHRSTSALSDANVEPVSNILVTVADVAQVVNSVFGSALNDVTVPSAPSSSTSTTSAASSGPGLPLHERLALVAVLNCIATATANTDLSRISIGSRTPGRKGKNDSNCPLMRVYGTYTSQCRQHMIDPLNQSDFTDVCGRLADKRLLAVAPPPAKQPLAGPSISLRVTVDEMKSFLAKHSLCNLMMTSSDDKM